MNFSVKTKATLIFCYFCQDFFSNKKIYLRWEKKFVYYLVCKSWNKIQALLILLSRLKQIVTQASTAFPTSSFSSSVTWKW